MREIKADVAKLQARGYYGDGFWSDGKRLADSVRMGGEGLRPSDFPEYICGVSSSCVHLCNCCQFVFLTFMPKGCQEGSQRTSAAGKPYNRPCQR